MLLTYHMTLAITTGIMKVHGQVHVSHLIGKLKLLSQ